LDSRGAWVLDAVCFDRANRQTDSRREARESGARRPLWRIHPAP